MIATRTLGAGSCICAGILVKNDRNLFILSNQLFLDRLEQSREGIMGDVRLHWVASSSPGVVCLDSRRLDLHISLDFRAAGSHTSLEVGLV